MSNHLNATPIFNARRPIAGLALFSLLVFSGMTIAAPITIQNTAGTWASYDYDHVAAPLANFPGLVEGLGTNSFYWGQPLNSPTDLKESLIFQGNATAITPGSTPFAIGALTHGNNAIYGDTNITSSNLNLQLSLAGSQSINFTYKFGISQDSTTYADTLTFSPVGSTQFSLASQTYSFNLLGFYNLGNLYSTIIVEDGVTVSQALLYASITSVPASAAPVPAPAALWLLGSGLLGLAGFAKRKYTHQ